MTEQSNSAAERSAHVHRGDAPSPADWPVVRMPDGTWKLKSIVPLENRIAELEEELSIWRSVFPDIAPERVLPDRRLLLDRIAQLEAKVNAVYSERNRLASAFARMALAAGFKAGKGVDPDETKWPVVYVDTPNGQVSWHIAEQDADVLSALPEYGGEWDGQFRSRDPLWPVWEITSPITAKDARIAELEAALRNLDDMIVDLDAGHRELHEVSRFINGALTGWKR